MQLKNLLKIKLLRHCDVTRYISTSVTTLEATAAATTKSHIEYEPSKQHGLKMSGWQIHSYGDLEELQFSDKLKVPELNCANQCLVRVRSTAVNPIDVAMLNGYGSKVLNVLRGKPEEGIEFPLVLGREFCGELVQRGMAVNKQLNLGERVWGVVPVHSAGAHAEYVVVPDFCLAKAPKELSDSEAAAVLYAGLTAWSGLYVTGGLGGICGATSSSGGGANKRVLVLGGSGAVGSLAVQMLKSQKVQVVATCSEDAVEMVHHIGADVVINYNDATHLEELRKYTPYDIVLDCAGQGAAQAEKLNVKFGQYITFSSPLLRNIDDSGMVSGMLKNVSNLLETNIKTLTQQGGLVKWGFFVPAPNGIKFLQKQVERKKLLPLIDSTFKFEELPEAYEKVQKGHLRGKVVVNLN